MKGTSGEDESFAKKNFEKNEFLASIEYTNDLPEIEFEMVKFPFPYNLSNLTGFKLPQFIKTYKNDALIGCGHPIGLDFMNLQKYDTVEDAVLSQEDQLLLTDFKKETVHSTKAENAASTVPWLRRSDYLLNEFKNSRKPFLAVETKTKVVGDNEFNVELFESREAQISFIERTFEDAKVDPSQQVQNCGKAKPVSVFPIFPHMSAEEDSACEMIMFDSHPLHVRSHEFLTDEEMKESVIKCCNDEDGEYYCYYIPKILPESLRASYEENGCYHYSLLREYDISTDGIEPINDLYVFSEENDTYVYTKISSKMKLQKRLNIEIDSERKLILQTVKNEPTD